MTIGERVHELLELQQKSAASLAEKLNIHKSSIAKWKSRQGNPKAEHLATIAEFFNVSAHYLLTGDDFCMEDYGVANDTFERIREVARKQGKDIEKICAEINLYLPERKGSPHVLVNANNIAPLADKLGVSTSYLLHGDGIKKEEAQLLSCFREMNTQGQSKLLDYAMDLQSTGNYIKNSESELVEEKQGA